MTEIVKISSTESVPRIVCRKQLSMAIGTFDGVHIGHQFLIKSAIECAKTTDGMSAVYTFLPYPTFVIKGKQQKWMIIPISEKYEILKKIGVDFIIEQAFGEDFSKKSPSEFVDFLKITFPMLGHIFVGEDFKFGCSGSGDTSTLKMLCHHHEITPHIIPRLRYCGVDISSSRIRQSINLHDFHNATALLGREYSPQIC